MLFWAVTSVLAVLAAAALVLAWQARRRHVDRWLVPYALQSRRRRAPRPGEPVHLLLCVADHFEPKWGNAPPEVALRRVESWRRACPSRATHSIWRNAICASMNCQMF